MLPIVSLRSVSRDDVDRVAWWLEDAEVSSRWFGQYAWGEPIHRSYEPAHMLESSDYEWRHIFGDQKSGEKSSTTPNTASYPYTAPKTGTSARFTSQ